MPFGRHAGHGLLRRRGVVPGVAVVLGMSVVVGGACAHASSGKPKPKTTRVGSSLPARLGPSRGRVFYVSQAGSNSNPGTRVRPWRTVQKAINSLKPGQTALVRGGVYYENLVVTRAGTRTKPITLRNYPGARPVIREANQGELSIPLRITGGAAFFRVRGFVFEDQKVSFGQNVWVSDHQETGPPPTHDIEISHCEIRNSVGSGILVSPNTANVQLIANVVHDNGDGKHQHQGIYFQGQHGLIANNIVYGHDGFGIQVRGNYENSDTASPIAARGTIVTGNTVIGNTLSGIMVENNAGDTTIVNNISAYNGSYAVRGYNDGGGTILAGNAAFRNLSWGNKGGTFGDTSGKIIRYSDNLVGNPRFVNVSRHDFRFGKQSIAVSKALPAYSLPVDYFGRPRGSKPDLGAIER
jgi:Right handed beta helix region